MRLLKERGAAPWTQDIWRDNGSSLGRIFPIVADGVSLLVESNSFGQSYRIKLAKVLLSMSL